MGLFKKMKPTKYYVVQRIGGRLFFNGPWMSRNTAEEWLSEYDYDEIVTDDERTRLLEEQRTRKLERQLGIQ